MYTNTLMEAFMAQFCCTASLNADCHQARCSGVTRMKTLARLYLKQGLRKTGLTMVLRGQDAESKERLEKTEQKQKVMNARP